jgi:hypothetical protein
MNTLALKLVWVAGATLLMMATVIASGSPQNEINYVGIAAVLGALGAFFTVIGTFIMQLLVFNQNERAMRMQESNQTALMAANQAQNAKLRETHDLVNSSSEELKAALAKASFAEGKDAGAAAERARIESAQQPGV